GWRVIGGIVAPPAFPAVVRPFPANGSEHVAAEDEGAEPFHGTSGEPVVDTGLAVVLALHLAKGLRREEPLENLRAVHPQRVLQALVGARGEAIERDAEPGHFHFGHRCLPLRDAAFRQARRLYTKLCS